MSEAYPTLNGEAQSWANIALTANIFDGPSVDCPDIASVKWNNDIERGIQRQTNGKIKQFTRGAATPGGSVEFYADGLQAFLEKVIDIAISRGFVESGVAKYSMVAFDLVITHTPLGATGIRKVELLGCRILKDGAEHSEGTDADKNTLELSITDVIRTINGKRGSM